MTWQLSYFASTILQMKLTTNPGRRMTQSVVMYVNYLKWRQIIDECGCFDGREDILMRDLHLNGKGPINDGMDFRLIKQGHQTYNYLLKIITRKTMTRSTTSIPLIFRRFDYKH